MSAAPPIIDERLTDRDIAMIPTIRERINMAYENNEVLVTPRSLFAVIKDTLTSAVGLLALLLLVVGVTVTVMYVTLNVLHDQEVAQMLRPIGWRIIQFCLIGFVGSVFYMFVEFWNYWELEIDGKFLVGFRYVIDFANGVIKSYDAGIFTRENNGVVRMEGTGPARLDYAGWALYYERLGLTIRFEDLKFCLIEKRGPLGKLVGYGDLVVLNMAPGGDFLFLHIKNPEYWRLFLNTLKEMHKDRVKKD